MKILQQRPALKNAMSYSPINKINEIPRKRLMDSYRSVTLINSS